jgi:hypothetical protein
MKKDGPAFLYLQQKFHRLSEAKIEEGIFCWPTNKGTYKR